MNLKRLEYFVAVAEQLHFTKAAEQLGVAQPALSQQVRRLENELGAELFHRSNRSVELSEYGKTLLPRARLLLHHASVAKAELRELAGLERGHLRVGASGTIAAFLLPEMLAEYRRIYPNVVLEIMQRRSEAILDAVESGRLDIGLIRLPFRRTTLEITPMFTEPLYAALPPDHHAASWQVLQLDDLESDPFIMPVGESEPFYSALLNLCAESDFIPEVISAGAEYTTVFRLVGMGMGVSVVSEQATELKVEPSPAFVRVDNPKATSPVVMVGGPKETLSPAAQAFHALVTRWRK